MNGIGTESRRWAAPFFTIWIGQMFSLVGSALGQFALVWWLTASTGSAAVLATASAAALLPTVLLGPLAGALVDRWDRRRTMIVADGAVALASAALAWLFWRGELQTWQVYAIVLVRAAGNLFHWPAMQASTALMVPERHLARVAGANQAARGAADIAAPPLGALLLALMPIYGVMLLDVAYGGHGHLAALLRGRAGAGTRRRGVALAAPRSAAGARLRMAPDGAAARLRADHDAALFHRAGL